MVFWMEKLQIDLIETKKKFNGCRGTNQTSVTICDKEQSLVTSDEIYSIIIVVVIVVIIISIVVVVVVSVIALIATIIIILISQLFTSIRYSFILKTRQLQEEVEKII